MATRHLASRLLVQQPRVKSVVGAGALQFLSCICSSSSISNIGTPQLLDGASEPQCKAEAFAAGPLLQNLAASRRAIPYPELLRLMQQQGFMPAAAVDAVGRLERTGKVFNLGGGCIMLRPGEVLPSSTDDTRQRLEAAQQQLAVLEEQQARIGRRAAWVQRGILWGGLVSQATLWGLLFYLSFYEMSWDVMEPICFLAGVAQLMACYLYLMVRRREFTWESVLEREVGAWQAKRLERMQFDKQRYRRLKEEVSLLSELLASQEAVAAAAAGAGGVADGSAEAGTEGK